MVQREGKKGGLLQTAGSVGLKAAMGAPLDFPKAKQEEAAEQQGQWDDAGEVHLFPHKSPSAIGTIPHGYRRRMLLRHSPNANQNFCERLSKTIF